MPDLSWFATIDGTVLGPLSPGQLHVLVERGWVRADTPIRHERMKRAVPAAQVHGLPPLRPPSGTSPGWVERAGPDLGAVTWGLVIFLAGVISAWAIMRLAGG